jgi:hypothetical protein
MNVESFISTQPHAFFGAALLAFASEERSSDNPTLAYVRWIRPPAFQIRQAESLRV